jgi:ribose transport system ATP-binding protein
MALGAATARACAAVAVRSTGPWQRAGELSGGNQQKVAFARLLCADAAVWLLDEPTRGIDVQSRRELYAALAARVAAGAAILVVSSQLDELLLLCDRIAVMRDGELGAARPATAWTQESLLRAALGGEAR